ncbi:sprouty-related, EVH1 domain-containing protein 2-like isoform X2 [Tubulanus polymorphus]|uniref:sprouty-related, EVH1 domain-containing protein 2-like isoform X2 n=1 Tax=Tubulanus polymorphus TaxID=672921 RepID=UPI003DA5ECD5
MKVRFSPTVDSSDDTLVQVKAQVMTRDDEIVGWVPMGGGGLSKVGLKKRVCSIGDGDIKHDYLIYGQRMCDNTIVLNCPLKKDVQYTKATPTFHHWRTEDKKFGLTFQNTADAKAFERGIRRAIEDLLEGSPESSQQPDLDMGEGEDDVFVQLDLPLGRKDSSSQSNSTTSTTTSSPTPQSPAVSIHGVMQEPYGPFISRPPHLHWITFTPNRNSTNVMKQSPSSENGKSISSESKEDNMWPKSSDKTQSDEIDNRATDCYVTFDTKTRPSSNNDYSYPSMDSITKPASRRDSSSSIKKTQIETLHPPLPLRKPRPRKDKDSKHHKADKQSKYLLTKKHARCAYCQKMFSVSSETSRGLCEDAPDKMHDVIERVSCICCARAMLYHCMADADGDYGHPCVCDSSDESNCKKWTALTILSFIVPCLWCYWPLTACHRCGVACGCCGGRHKAA